MPSGGHLHIPRHDECAVTWNILYITWSASGPGYQQVVSPTMTYNAFVVRWVKPICRFLDGFTCRKGKSKSDCINNQYLGCGKLASIHRADLGTSPPDVLTGDNDCNAA
jgi:hypothetical protein